MADSTLTLSPDAVAAFPPGHGTEALGPSDSSDSGSDVAGAGAGLGDSNLDSDTDRNGTGERGAVGRDPMDEPGADIAPDAEIDSIVDLDLPEETLADAEEAAGVGASDATADELADAQLGADEGAIEKLDRLTPR
ncbi:hypothetical protein [Derxia gummosa]|uniref:Chemotaxis protein n=1 Tax=Derxia gummosa DSM 723 TaxID=1121388 RepID=A0A9U5D037_9BURK|nr:hypothetical protein [Derxia gummosa]